MKQEPGRSWEIGGKLIDRQVFTVRKDGEIKHLLVILILDSQGDVIEMKSWGRQKAFTVYRKFQLEQYVVINGTGFFREPNKTFSMAKCDCYSRWYMETIDDLRFEKFLDCVSSIDQYYKSKKPATIVGIFEDFAEELRPPVKKNRQQVILAEGRYLRCTGDTKNQFLLLVWQPTRRERNSPLSNCVPGKTIVLLPYARLQSDRYSHMTPNERVLTATYPPVIDPTFINPKVVKKLRDVASSTERGRRPQHNPISQTNGIS